MNYKRKTEKDIRSLRRLGHARPLEPNSKIDYILEGIREEFGNPKNTDALNNLKYDKTALYLAAKDIFKDVTEEYTSKDIIISRFYELKDKYNFILNCLLINGKGILRKRQKSWNGLLRL